MDALPFPPATARRVTGPGMGSFFRALSSQEQNWFTRTVARWYHLATLTVPRHTRLFRW